MVSRKVISHHLNHPESYGTIIFPGRPQKLTECQRQVEHCENSKESSSTRDLKNKLNLEVS